MSSNTKIVVLRMKEIIYTAIFVGLGILLVALLFIMFRPKNDTPVTSDQVLYIPGVYSSTVILGSQEINVEVAVDADRITSVSLVSLSDSVTTMYPLVHPSFENLKTQIYEKQSLDGLTYQEENRYTSQTLIHSIQNALNKASVDQAVTRK